MKKIILVSRKLISPIIFFILGLIIGWTIIYLYINREPTYTIAEINQQLINISIEKDKAYVEWVNYFKSIGQDIDSATLKAHITSIHPELDMKIEYLNQLKEKLAQEEVIKNLRE